MRIATWNLFGLESKNLDARTEAALFELLLGGPAEQVFAAGGPSQAPPQVILLQEVVERTWFAHLRPHLQAAGYQLFPTELPARNYFEVIAVRDLDVLGHRVSRFDRTGQGRHLNRVDLNTPSGPLSVFTAHLESLRTGAELRAEQSERVVLAMQSCARAVFGGDTNLRTDEVVLPASIQDAFVQSGSPKRYRSTWRHARYDRFWLHGVQIDGFESFGGENVPGLDEPASDHLGLRIGIKAANLPADES